jgi:hypothetical protein
MIDDKRLDEWADEIRQSAWAPSNDEADELIRLARRGLRVGEAKEALEYVHDKLDRIQVRQIIVRRDPRRVEFYDDRARSTNAEAGQAMNVVTDALERLK